MAVSGSDRHWGSRQGLMKPWPSGPVAKDVILDLPGLEIESWLPTGLTHGSLASLAVLCSYLQIKAFQGWGGGGARARGL